MPNRQDSVRNLYNQAYTLQKCLKVSSKLIVTELGHNTDMVMIHGNHKAVSMMKICKKLHGRMKLGVLVAKYSFQMHVKKDPVDSILYMLIAR